MVNMTDNFKTIFKNNKQEAIIEIEEDIKYSDMEEKVLFSRGHTGEKFDLNGSLDEDEFQRLMIWCVKNKVSDVTIQSGEPVWCEIGGKKEKVTQKIITHPEITRLSQIIYGDNAPSELNSGNDLDPSYEVKEQEDIPGKAERKKIIGRWRFRVNITTGRMIGGDSYSLTIRTLPSQPIEISKLGIEDDIIKHLRPAQGMNLFTGPTGSGKSTLMSSVLRYLCEKNGEDEPGEKVLEYASPIEFVYDGLAFPRSVIHQSEVGKHIRSQDPNISDWTWCIRNALRRKPDIISIGEARDKETIKECIKGASTGHLVMSTMHTIGVAETIRRAVIEFPSQEQVGVAADLLDILNLVVTQLLIPRKGGGKIGCREYMVFDKKARSALLGLNLELWPSRIRELLFSKQVIGSSMADSARKLLEQDEITPETFEWISNRSSNESSLVRHAIARGLIKHKKIDSQ